jgi:hypothetical protein
LPAQARLLTPAHGTEVGGTEVGDADATGPLGGVNGDLLAGAGAVPVEGRWAVRGQGLGIHVRPQHKAVQEVAFLRNFRGEPPPALRPPRTPCLLGPACGAGRHPSSPVILLHEPAVGQRGISAQIIQLLVPVAADYIGALQSLPPLPPGIHCPCHSLRHLGPAAACPAQHRPHSPYLLALHCCFCNHWSYVRLKLAVVVLPVVVCSAAAAGRSGCTACVEAGRCGSLTHAAACCGSPERLRVLLWGWG